MAECAESRQAASAYEVLEMSPSGHEEVVSLKNFSEEKHVVDMYYTDFPWQWCEGPFRE